MTTDVLSPRFLGPFLELYGFNYASYLGMYLSNYELFQNHITGVDCDLMDRALGNDDRMRDYDFTVVLCMGTSNGAEIMVLGNQEGPGELLIVRPSTVDDLSVEGAAVFGTENLVHWFQEFMGEPPTRTSQRPEH